MNQTLPKVVTGSASGAEWMGKFGALFVICTICTPLYCSCQSNSMVPLLTPYGDINQCGKRQFLMHVSIKTSALNHTALCNVTTLRLQ